MNENRKTDADKTFWLIIPPESPCGCESGKTFGDCHLKNGNIQLTPKNINPPMPMTWQSIKKCYFALTNDCGGGISKEHIISRAVLSRIADKQINFTKNGTTQTCSLDSSTLTIKRLCRRHNTAINPIDYQAGRFFGTVKRAQNIVKNRETTNQRLYLFHGFDLERWLLKTLLNVYYSRSSVDPQKFVLPPNLINYFFNSINPPYGLYIPTKLDNELIYEMQLAPITSANLIIEGNLICGLAISLAGLELKFIIAGHPQTLKNFSVLHTYRPKYVNFFQENEVISIAIAWTFDSGNAIWLMPDINAVPPRGIWE